MSLQIYSQSTILNSTTGDTSFCFTKQQSQFLLKSYYEAEELKKTDSLKNKIITTLDTTVKMLEEVNVTLDTNLKNCMLVNERVNQINVNNNIRIEKTSKENKVLNKYSTITTIVIIIETFFLYLIL